MAILLGDLHVNEQRSGKKQYNGINPNDVIYDSLRVAFERAKITNQMVVLGGDVFDRQNSNEKEFQRLCSFFNEYPEVPVFSLVGNHDSERLRFFNKPFSRLNYLYSLQEALPNFNIIESGDFVEEGKIRIYGVSYFKYATEFRKQISAIELDSNYYNFLFTHQDFKEHVFNEENSYKDEYLKSIGFHSHINAHIHQPSEDDRHNFINIGSLTTQTRSDISVNSKRYLEISSTGVVESIPFDGQPTFIPWDSDTVDYGYNFIAYPQNKFEVNDESIDISIGDDRVHFNINKEASLHEFLNCDIGYLLKYIPDDTGKQRKTLTINKVVAEGFLSHADVTELEFTRRGIRWIRGDIGSGKSSLLSMVYWGLCGHYMSDRISVTDPTSLEGWASQVDTFKGCRVMLYFNLDGEDYILARHKKYKGVTFDKNGKDTLQLYKVEDDVPVFVHFDTLYAEELGTKNDIRVQTDKLHRLLGIDKDMVKYTMLISPKSSNLLTLASKELEKVFNSLNDIDWVDDLVKGLTNDLADDKEVINSKQLVIEKLIIKRDAIKSTFDHKTQVYNEQLEKLEEQRKEISRLAEVANKELATFTHKRTEVESELDKLSVDNVLLTELEQELVLIQQQQRDIRNSIQELANEKSKIESDIELNIKLLEDINKLSDDLDSLTVPDVVEKPTTEYRDSCDDVIADGKKLKLKKSVVNEQILVNSNQLTTYRNKLQEIIDTPIDENCDRCGQLLPEEEIHSCKAGRQAEIGTIEAKIEKLESEQKELELQLNQLEAEILIAREEYTKLVLLADMEKEQEEQWKRDQKLISEYHESVDTIKNSIDNKQKRLTLLKDHTHLKDTEDRIKVSEEELLKTSARYTEVSGKLEDLSNSKEFILKNKLERERIELDGLIKQKESERDSLLVRYKLLDDSTLDYIKNEIDKYKQEYVELVEEICELELELSEVQEVFEERTRVLSSIKSPKFRAFIVNKYLHIFNAHANSVCTGIGLKKVEVGLDKNLRYQIKMTIPNGETLISHQMSTGWKTVCNQILLYSLIKFREMYQVTNLLFLDEPFSTVKEHQLVYLMNIIKKLSNYSLNVISHAHTLDHENAEFLHVEGGLVIEDIDGEEQAVPVVSRIV